MAGKLYLCATPIGNLGDITYRVVETLKNADLIAAEDTRGSIRLLNHFDIHVPMTSYHEYNKYEKGRVLVQKMLAAVVRPDTSYLFLIMSPAPMKPMPVTTWAAIRPGSPFMRCWLVWQIQIDARVASVDAMQISMNVRTPAGCLWM